MSTTNIDERTLSIKAENGEEVIHQVSEMNEEAQALYSKLEMLNRESVTLKLQADFKLEQNDILQRHYLEALKPHLSSEVETLAD